MKAFKQFRVDYIVGLKDAKFGNTDLIAANKQDDEHWQLQKWSEGFKRARYKIEKGKKGYDTILDYQTDYLFLKKDFVVSIHLE